jgi:hypothetical protein
MRPVHAGTGTGTIGNDAGAVTVAAIPTLFRRLVSIAKLLRLWYQYRWRDREDRDI